VADPKHTSVSKSQLDEEEIRMSLTNTRRRPGRSLSFEALEGRVVMSKADVNSLSSAAYVLLESTDPQIR
jgi:hypothetical protein